MTCLCIGFVGCYRFCVYWRCESECFVCYRLIDNEVLLNSEKRRIYDGMVKKGSNSMLQQGYDDGAHQKDKTNTNGCHRLDQFFKWVYTPEETGI
ncbi:hypothetical protein Hanom_Chr10g00878391 [Helianthus anomalus]